MFKALVGFATCSTCYRQFKARIGLVSYRVLTRILKIGVKSGVFSKMLDSSHSLLLGLFKKLGVIIKKLEFKTPILELRILELRRTLQPSKNSPTHTNLFKT